jgi:hypothetical protein
MPGEVSLADALLVAHPALQAQVAAVNLKMSIQVTFLSKGFVTNATGMRFQGVSCCNRRWLRMPFLHMSNHVGL